MNKILHIISSLNVGGAEMMLYRILKEGKNRLNEKHIVISLLPKGELKDRIQAEDVDVFMLDIKNKPFSSCKDIIRIIKNNNPKVIQTWMYHADFFGGVLARIIGFKNIFWGIRNTYVPQGSTSTYLLMKLLSLLSYFIPKKIICVAESAKASHIQYGYSSKKMQTISNGYDFNHLVENSFSDVRKEFGLTNQTIVIGCLGRYHKDKGQDLFIEAISKFPRGKFKFMLVGRECDWNNEKLVDLIDYYNLRDYFILTGERSDVISCLSTFDIFCMPSRTEGFPNSLAEAMAVGIPCVGFNVGDASKLKGEGVKLVESGNVDNLFLELDKIAHYTELQRKEMGEIASTRVKENFSIEKICEEYKKVYGIR